MGRKAMMTIGDTIEAKAEYLQNQHLAQVEKQLGDTAEVVRIFAESGNEEAARNTLFAALKLMDPKDAASIDKGTVMALITSYRSGATVRSAGAQMTEKMATMPEKGFTEIREAGRKKISGLWGKMKDMKNEVRNFIMQRGNPRVTQAY